MPYKTKVLNLSTRLASLTRSSVLLFLCFVVGILLVIILITAVVAIPAAAVIIVIRHVFVWGS